MTRRRVGIAIALAAAASALGCREAEPRPQWLVHIGTDAAVPGFGDRILVDVIDDAGEVCGECSRIFEVGPDKELPLSFGVAATGKDAPNVRVRLYRAEATGNSGAPLDPIIDLFAKLPKAGKGIADVRAVLSMQCFGKPADIVQHATCNPADGTVATDLALPLGGPDGLPQPGSWGPANDPCPSEVPEGMVCIEGGVFLLGNRTYVPFGPDFDPVPQQLVHVPTFFIDADEMTVARLRPLVEGGVPSPVKYDALQRPLCAYATPAPDENASANCLDYATAKAACEALGRRLPTEAEWEFASGGRVDETPYPWRLDDSSEAEVCAHAVIARTVITDDQGSRACLRDAPGLSEGPQPGGSTSDETPLGVRNLGGNVAEWVADAFAQYGDPVCWGPDVELRDQPVCKAATTIGVIRGGSYRAVPYDAHAFFRNPFLRAGYDPSVGFRCAASYP